MQNEAEKKTLEFTDKKSAKYRNTDNMDFKNLNDSKLIKDMKHNNSSLNEIIIKISIQGLRL